MSTINDASWELPSAEEFDALVLAVYALLNRDVPVGQAQADYQYVKESLKDARILVKERNDRRSKRALVDSPKFNLVEFFNVREERMPDGRVQLVAEVIK